MTFQQKQIADYIDKHGSITQMEATYELDITKLSTRVSEMIRAGFEIKKETIRTKNKFGKPIWFTQYSWKEKSEPEATDSQNLITERN
jgi:hypothetical protein